MNDEPCELCHMQQLMQAIIQMLDNAPVLGAALYDDAIYEVFEAAHDAYNMLHHEHEESEP